jgi:quinol monooxygenase YgiN
MYRGSSDSIIWCAKVCAIEESGTREGARMFAAIRYYRIAPDSIGEVVRRIEEGFVPIIRDTPGFMSYFVLAPSERESEIVAVSLFEDQQSAEESNKEAEEWVGQNLSELVLPPELAIGNIVVYEAK